MPGIWTWRGNSSTARSGWVAADTAQQPLILLTGCLRVEQLAEERSHLGIIDRTGRAGANRATIPSGRASTRSRARIPWFIVHPMIKILPSIVSQARFMRHCSTAARRQPLGDRVPPRSQLDRAR